MHLLAVFALLAAQADAPGDAGPQPGDVDTTFPIVQEQDAAAVDPAPAHVKKTPQTVTTAPTAVTSPAAVQDVAATHDPEEGHAAPASDAPAVPDDDAMPTIDKTKARPDPDGVPKVPPPAPKDVEAPQHAPPEGIGFGGVPAINYDSDNGFGFGIVGTLFYYDGHTRPYRAALTLQIFMTSKLVQDHNIVLDWLDVGELPLRLYTRVGYNQSLTANYCGVGGHVTCDPKVAEAAAATLDGDAADAFARHFYQRRFIDPYGTVQARWALVKEPARFEITGGYRGFYYAPGTWDDDNGDKKPDLFPYPGSLYAKDHPDGEPGFDSAVSAGFMVDTRDNEPAPTEGIWLEASVRESSKLIGSTWDWTGANLTLRGYAPLMADHKLVWANRFVVDGVIGDPPVQELVRVGGSNDYYVYGGSEAGRGIRAQRYIGKLRAYDQNEVRWHFLDVGFLDQTFGFTAAGFADVGVVGKEIGDPGEMDLLPGFGGALRLSWNENFIVRFDVGFSPIESYTPSLYILIGNPF